MPSRGFSQNSIIPVFHIPALGPARLQEPEYRSTGKDLKFVSPLNSFFALLQMFHYPGSCVSPCDRLSKGDESLRFFAGLAYLKPDVFYQLLPKGLIQLLDQLGLQKLELLHPWST